MHDDAIRDEFRDLGERRLGTPKGHLSVSLSDVAASGIDADEAGRWVEAHGGYLQRQRFRRFGRFVVPEAALRGS